MPTNVRFVQKSNTDTNGRIYGTIQAAINSITNASATNLYVVKVMPGVYTVTSPIQMKSFVDIEGSGQENTVITSTIAHDPVCIYDDPGPAMTTVVMAANSKIGNLRVENKSNLGGIAIWDGNVPTTAAVRDCVFEASNPRLPDGTAAAIYGFATNANIEGTKAFVHDSAYCAAIESVATVIHSEARVANCTEQRDGIISTGKVESTLIENGNVAGALDSVGKVVNCWDENFNPIPTK